MPHISGSCYNAISLLLEEGKLCHCLGEYQVVKSTILMIQIAPWQLGSAGRIPLQSTYVATTYS